MLYMAGPLATMLLVYREVPIFGFTASAASFLSPIWYLTSDIVTEVYGYKVSRNLFWCWGAAGILTASLLNMTIYLHSPENWHDAYAYKIVMGHLLKDVIDAWLVMGVSNFLNTYLISKSKIYLGGKFFWLRSIVASSAGVCTLEILFQLGLIGTLPTNTLLSMMSIGIVIKIICIVILIVPCSFITSTLKRVEKIDVYDYSTNYNPFMLKTD